MLSRNVIEYIADLLATLVILFSLVGTVTSALKSAVVHPLLIKKMRSTIYLIIEAILHYPCFKRC